MSSEQTQEPEKFAEITVTLHTEEGMMERRGLAHPLRCVVLHSFSSRGVSQ